MYLEFEALMIKNEGITKGRDRGKQRHDCRTCVSQMIFKECLFPLFPLGNTTIIIYTALFFLSKRAAIIFCYTHPNLSSSVSNHTSNSLPGLASVFLRMTLGPLSSMKGEVSC